MRWDAAADEAAVRLQRVAESGHFTDEEAADLSAVLHGLRCYRFELDSAQATVERVIASRRQSEAGMKATLHRVGCLVNHKRKTLAMADLKAALEGRHETAEPDARTETDTRTGDRA